MELVLIFKSVVIVRLILQHCNKALNTVVTALGPPSNVFCHKYYIIFVYGNDSYHVAGFFHLVIQYKISQL